MNRSLCFVVLVGIVAAGLPAWAKIPLVDAAKANDRTGALKLLAAKVDAAAAENDGTTALHWAAHNGDLALVDRLIAAGAKVDALNDYGSSPLREAALGAHRDVVARLLKAGANADAANADGETALMVVARNSDVEMAKLLLDHGASVNAVDKFKGNTALLHAAAQSQPAMVRELIAHKADVNARATVNNWDRQVTGEPRAVHRPVGGLTPLLYAAREGCFDCAKAIVEAGADVNVGDPERVTPIIMAISNGHFDVAAYLLSKGASANKFDRWGRGPLYEAVDQNTLPHGGRPDRPSLDQTTSLKMIQLLLDAGANPNLQVKLNPPYRAVGNDRGLDGMLVTGTTPLLRAAKAADAPAIELLLKHGARMDIANNTGFLPFPAVAGVGSTDADTRGWYTTADTQPRVIAALEVMLKAGADINQTSGRRAQTALHGAAFWGWNDVTQYLIKKGAKLDVKDNQGKTVVDAAMGRAGGNSRGGNRIDIHQDTAELLIKLGAPGPIK